MRAAAAVEHAQASSASSPGTWAAGIRAVFPVSECLCPCRHVLSVRVPESAGAAPGGLRATFGCSSTRDPRWMSCETGRF